MIYSYVLNGVVVAELQETTHENVTRFAWKLREGRFVSASTFLECENVIYNNYPTAICQKGEKIVRAGFTF